MVEVFDDLYLGLIHNIDAKGKLTKVFALEDQRYKNRDFLEVLSITDFLKERLSVAVAKGADSLFQRTFKLYWKCETCGIKCSQSTYIGEITYYLWQLQQNLPCKIP